MTNDGTSSPFPDGGNSESLFMERAEHQQPVDASDDPSALDPSKTLSRNHGESAPAGFEGIHQSMNQPADAPKDDTGITAELLAEAEEYGFSKEQIDGLDAKRVISMMAAVDRQAIKISQQQAQQQPQQPFQGFDPTQQQPIPLQFQGNHGINTNWPMPNPANPAPMSFPGQQGQQQQPLQQPPKFELNLKEDEWDDSALKVFGQLSEHIDKLNQTVFHQQQNQIQQQQAQQWQQQQAYQQEAQQQEAWFDSMVTGLNQEELFGKGTIQSLGQRSAAYNNRMAIADAYVSLEQSYPNLPKEILFQRAMRASFGEQLDQQKQQKISDQVTNRSQQAIQRPASRQSTSAQSRMRDPQTGVTYGALNSLENEIRKLMD